MDHFALAARVAMTVERSREVFMKRCRTGEDGCMSVEEPKALLRGLGAFKDSELNAALESAGAVNGRIGLEDMVTWLQTDKSALAARIKAVLLPGSDDNPEAVLYSFCVPGSLEWDGKCFLKLCRDTDILDDSFTAVDADLTFTKALRKGQRRLSLPQLREALCAVAEKKSVPPSELFEQIAACSGPRLQGTKAKPVRLHAASASVPMANLDSSSRALPTLMSRKPSDGPSSARSSGPGSTKILATAAQAVVAASPSLRQDGTSSYQEVFKAFCGSGRRAMDGPSFSKLCKDCGLIDKRLSAVDADLIFAKVCSRGHRKISMAQFEEAVWMVGRKRGVDYGALLEQIANSAGPLLTATQAQNVPFEQTLSLPTHGEF